MPGRKRDNTRSPRGGRYTSGYGNTRDNQPQNPIPRPVTPTPRLILTPKRRLPAPAMEVIPSSPNENLWRSPLIRNNPRFSSGNQPNPFANTPQVFSVSNTFGNPTPAFGQTSSNMFGSQQPTPLFGSTTTPSFGAPTQNAFGSSGLFGQPSQPQQSAPIFGGPSTSFGQANKTGGFSFPSTQPSIFGQSSQPQAPQTNVFQTPSNTSIFGSSSFGSQPAQSGTVIKFSPVMGTDSMQKGGNTTTINTKHHSITCMKEYESKSFEELRFEDYSVNRKGPQQSSGFGGSAQPFGAAPTATPLFGQPENKPAFGAANGFGQTSTFGVPSQTSTSQGIFAKPATPFGSTVTTASSFAFPSSTNNIFGSTPAKPFSTQPSQSLFPNTSQQPSGFGQSFFGPTNQQQPSFPTQTGSYSFGQPTTSTQSSLFQPPKSSAGFGGIFSTNQATTSTAFGQPSTSGFTGFNSTFAKPATNTFGQPAQQQIGFGSNMLMNQNPTSNLFGGMGAKPTFGTGNTSGGLFSTPGLQMNNQPFSLQMQPVSQPMVLSAQSQTAEMRGLLNLSDPYGLSPHLDGLTACKSDTTHYVTNPKELDDVIKKQDYGPTSSHGTKKLKLNMPNTAMNKLFDEAYAVDDAVKKNFGIRRNLKQLIIKTPVKKPEPIIVYQHGKIIDGNTSGNSGNMQLPAAFQSPTSTTNNMAMGDSTPDTTQEKNEPAKLNTSTSTPVIEVNAFDKLQSEIEASTKKASEEKKTVSTSTETTETDKPSSSKIDTCGIVSTRPEYYTIPPLDEIANYKNPDGTCYIKGFTIGRVGYGNVYFPEVMDVSNLNIDELVHFRFREIIIYPDDEVKPPVGEGLNRRAQVTLDTVYPRKKDNENEFEKDPEEILKRHYTETLKFACERAKTTFVDYRPETGSWVFNVVHFSKYDLTVSEEKICEEKYEQQQQQHPPTQTQEPQPQRMPNKDDTPTEKKKKGQLEMVFHEPMEIPPMDQGDIHRGMGGYTITSVTDPLVDLNISTSNRYNLEQSDNIYLMRSLFFDNEPVDKTLVDADAGDVITMSHQIVNMEKNYNDNVIRKQYEAVRDIFTLSNKLYRAPVQHSLIPAKCMVDAAILKGKSYKVGWGRGFTLATIFSEAVDGVSHVSSSLETYVYTPTQILLVDISQSRHQKKETDPFMNKLPRFMEIVLENSTCVLETIRRPWKQVPRWEINIGHELTEQLCDYWETHNDRHKDNPKLKYYKNIFDLCLTFWGPIEGPHPAEVVRKELFNDWLENVTEELMNAHLNKIGSHDTLNRIMVYLSGHKIKEAAKLAASSKMPHLSLLLSQLNCNKNTRYCTGFQVKSWEDSGAIDFVGENHLKLYIICCGVLYYGLMNACEGLDWLRALGMHLWYQTETTSSLKRCFEIFENAFYGENAYAEKPYPLFGSAEYSWDIMYYLMKLYCDEKLDLDVILSPATHTNDCIDYRLSWFLMQTLHSLQVGVLSKDAINKIVTLFATQLEQLGYFKWAVFVLLFLSDMRMRENLVFQILERNLTDSPYDGKIELELFESFNVPLDWIHRIKSLKTKQLQRYWEAYRHLAHAQLWHELHDLFVEKTLPIMIANRHFPLLKGILSEIEQGQNEIPRWKTCGGFVLEFVTLWMDIQENMHCADAYQYKQMYTSINKFAWKINSYPTTDLSQNMIVSIISQKTAEMFNNLLVMLQIEKKTYIEMTSNLLQRLIMPNDLKYEKFSNLLLAYKKL